MGDSLDEVLGEVETTDEIVVEPAPVEEPAQEAAKDDVEPDPGEKADTDVSPASEETDTKVPLSVVHGERDRRQAAEKRAADAEAMLEASKKEDVEPTSFFTDEPKARAEIIGDVDNALSNFSLNQSEFFARREFGSDVMDAKIETFKAIALDNPTLVERFKNSISPYHELSDIVDQHDELKKMEDIDGFRETIRAEERAKLKKEMADEADGKAALRNSVPESLVGDTSKGGLTSKDWGGPPSLDDVLAE